MQIFCTVLQSCAAGRQGCTDRAVSRLDALSPEGQLQCRCIRVKNLYSCIRVNLLSKQSLTILNTCRRIENCSMCRDVQSDRFHWMRFYCTFFKFESLKMWKVVLAEVVWRHKIQLKFSSSSLPQIYSFSDENSWNETEHVIWNREAVLEISEMKTILDFEHFKFYLFWIQNSLKSFQLGAPFFQVHTFFFLSIHQCFTICTRYTLAHRIHEKIFYPNICTRCRKTSETVKYFIAS